MKGWMYSWIFWIPRVLVILFIIFMLLMSLDVYSAGMPWLEVALGMLMHNIPTIIVTALLLVSWKRELVGAIAFTILAILYMISARGMFPAIYITLLLVGALFFVNWHIKRNSSF